MNSSRRRQGLGLYVCVEPLIRNIAQLVAAGALMADGHYWLGAGLASWAAIDLLLKASAGLLLIRGER
jgi:hypothetical protein